MNAAFTRWAPPGASLAGALLVIALCWFKLGVPIHAVVVWLVPGLVAGLCVGALLALLRRAWRSVMLNLGLVLGVVVAWCARPPATAVVVVVVDCLSAARLGAELMPHTDALSPEAWRFPYMLAQSSWTRSAVGSMLTGSWPRRHGLYHLKPTPDRLVPGTPTLAQVFADAGWSTAMFAEQAQLDPAFGLNAGFQRYHHRDGPAPGLIARFLRWNTLFRHQPRFAWLHLLDVHKPYTPDPRWLGEVEGAAPLALNLPEDWTTLMAEVNQGKRTLSAEEWAWLERLHEAEVSQLDETLGQLWSRLEADGSLERTWLVVTADHGEAFGEHGWFTHGGPPHAELVEVPLLVRPPAGSGGPARGSRFAWAPRQVDLAPTLLGWVGLESSVEWDGDDLGEVWAGRAPAPDLSVAEYENGNVAEGYSAGIRQARWSLIFAAGRHRLYDHENDPGETVDLAPKEPTTVLRLAADLGALRGDSTLASGPVPAETTEALRAMGYLR